MNVLCSCDGIFCGSYFVWNLSIRKFKLLPPLENSLGHVFQLSFGYDHFIHNYKVIVDSNENEVFIYDENGYIKLVVYDSKTGTLNTPEFPNNYEHIDAIVYIESLISP